MRHITRDASKTQKNCFLSGKVRFYYATTHCLHLFLRFLFWWRFRKPVSGPPQKVLLANWGALGDVVLSTGVIAEIKSAFPNCQIGLIVSEKSKDVCTTCPCIDWIHLSRPWAKLGRSRWKKIADLLYFLFYEQPRLGKEVSSIGYDLAIELRPFFPNLIPLFWKARIPIRIGFMTSGNYGLLNKAVHWTGDQYLPHCYWPLLEKMGIKRKKTHTLMPQMILRTRSTLLAQKPYLLFHLCSSNPVKELPVEFWNELYSKCKELGYNIYFTGKGAREFRMIEQVTQDPRENLCNQLSWEQLVQHIQECQGLVSIDSVPIHLAAGFKVPTLAFFCHTESPWLWNPQVSTTTSLGIEKSLQMTDALQVIQSWR